MFYLFEIFKYIYMEIEKIIIVIIIIIIDMFKVELGD